MSTPCGDVDTAIISGHSSVEMNFLRERIQQLCTERDTAVEMWRLCQEVIERAKDQLKKVTSGTQLEEVSREMEQMKSEYSEAIKLMQKKSRITEQQLKIYKDKNKSLEDEMNQNQSALSDADNRICKLESLLESTVKERDALAESLKSAKEMLRVAERISLTARDKVADALTTAQDALANEASMADEKRQLEEKLNHLLEASEEKLGREIQTARDECEQKINQMATQLHTATLERNKLKLELQAATIEAQRSQNEFSSRNKGLSIELDELRSKRQSELSALQEERILLRSQVTQLQADLDSVMGQLKKRLSPCPDCDDYKEQASRYRQLAKKWEDTADSMSKNFEKYLKEIKTMHLIQDDRESMGDC